MNPFAWALLICLVIILAGIIALPVSNYFADKRYEALKAGIKAKQERESDKKQNNK